MHVFNVLTLSQAAGKGGGYDAEITSYLTRSNVMFEGLTA